MLNISIPQLKARFRSLSSISELLEQPLKVETKYDGVKLTLVKTSEKDWIPVYKSQVLFPGEFSYQTDEGLNTTIGTSQFRKVQDHLETLTPEQHSGIPVGTELFCEFIVRKDTVMSEYTQTGAIILLGYAQVEPEVKFGKLYTNPDEMQTSRNAEFAENMGFNLPDTLVDGALYPTDLLISNTQHPALSAKFEALKYTLKSLETDKVAYLNKVLDVILELESKFGGKDEGVVIHCNGLCYKHQQSYQLDPEYRKSKKLRFREESADAENAYWADVLEIAKSIASKVETQDIQQGLEQIATQLQELNFNGVHSKRTESTSKDDIQHHAKAFYLKSLKGNNNGLVIGKFRVLTVGHQRMIEKALHECDHVVIGLVTSGETKDTRDLRAQAIQKAFPNVTIIDLISANIATALRKAKININHIYTGSDRLDDYVRQSSKIPGTNVHEIVRDSEEISATKVIENLKDYSFFKLNTPKAVHSLYSTYVDSYQ